jgi:hypothetical protein
MQKKSNNRKIRFFFFPHSATSKMSCPLAAAFALLLLIRAAECQVVKSANGTACLVNADCQSNFCVTVLGIGAPNTKVCCDKACASATTDRCSSCETGRCLPCTLTSGCNVTINSATCVPLPCANVVKGWVGTSCHRYAQNNARALCKPVGNTCTVSTLLTDFAFCESATVAVATCGSAACINTAKCQAGTAVSLSNTTALACLAPGTTCGLQQACSSNGTCLAAAASVCTDDSDCASGFCGGAAANLKCCTTSCKSPCKSCATAGTCTSTCSVAGGCANAECAAVPCKNRVKGWANATVSACQFYGADAPGTCSSRSDTTLTGFALGDCATTIGYCAGAAASINETIVCGSVACRRPGACLAGSAAPTNLSDVCLVSLERGACASPLVCSASGTCLQPFGRPCTTGAQCGSGICSRGVCCASQCGECQTCNATGVCVSNCAVAVGCAPTMGDCAGSPIPCNSTVSGWSGTVCQRYAADLPRFCLRTGVCATPTQTNLCNSQPFAALTKAPLQSCDLGCVNAARCPINGPVDGSIGPANTCFTAGAQKCPTASQCTNLGVCKAISGNCAVKGDCPSTTPECYGPAPGFKFCCENKEPAGWSHPCQTCSGGKAAFICNSPSGCVEPSFNGTTKQCTTPIRCAGRVKGWNGAVCEKFSSDEPGKCRPMGLCATADDYALCSLGAGVAALACGDPNCRRLDGCNVGDPSPTLLSDICFVAGEAGACGPNNSCDATGTCVPPTTTTTAPPTITLPPTVEPTATPATPSPTPVSPTPVSPTPVSPTPSTPAPEVGTTTVPDGTPTTGASGGKTSGALTTDQVSRGLRLHATIVALVMSLSTMLF